MVAQEKNYNYESLLEDLRVTHETSKKRFTQRKHLMSDEDRAFDKFLFSLESDVLSKKNISEKEVVHFNFDELMHEISGGDALAEYSENSKEVETSASGCSERKHTCTYAGCNKSYTSSHGLKYHLLHGHSKEKENVYKPFICTVAKCGKSYRNSNGLKYHMANAHSKSNNRK